MTQIYPDSPDEQPLRTSTSPAPLPTPSSPSSHPHPSSKARQRSLGAAGAKSVADPAPIITPDSTPANSHAPQAVSSIDMNPISASAPLSYPPLPDFAAMSNYGFTGNPYPPPLPTIPTLSSYYQQPQHDEHGQDDFRRHQHPQQGQLPQYPTGPHYQGIPPPRTPQNPGPLSYPASRGYGQQMTFPPQYNSSPPFPNTYGLNTASSGMPLNQQGFYNPHPSPHAQQQYAQQGTPGSALSSPISATYPSALPSSNTVNTPNEPRSGKPEKPMCWDHGCNGREFSTFSNLLRHQREKSGNAHKSTCPRCGAVFTRTTARNGHMEHGKCKGRKVDGDSDTWSTAVNANRKVE